MKRIINAVTAGALLCACAAFARPAAAAVQNSPTLEHLMAAYNGESNANAKYLAYAQKADQEGYARVAQLFRAAADSERVHAAMHAKVITELGGTPAADVKQPDVKSTKENLEDAITGEGYETDTMYPQFLKQAEAEKIKDAAVAFERAGEVEGNHRKMYRQALGDLAAWKQAAPGFLVCQVCGNLVAKIDFARCPVCTYPASEYRRIA
jgi:rubrerythrin